MEKLRMCVACKQMQDKRNLLRIVKNKENQIFIDNTGKANGRGAYICKNEECLEKLKKQKALNRTFKCEISSLIYDEIEKVIHGQN
ncbi:MAG: YlxR family protein [Clostridia bacterium]|nr:YlxR family protein [Clostridia bacterium]